MGIWKAIFSGKKKEDGALTIRSIQASEPSPIIEVEHRDSEARMRAQIAKKVYNSTNQIAEGMSEIAQDIDLLASGQKDSFSNIDQLKEDITCTNTIAKKSATLVDDLQGSAKNLSSLKSQLEDQANRLKTLKTTIANIFEIGTHVKLLSFNASLEASRAGEAGRPFMVVADEIEKLSNITQQHLDEMNRALELYSEKNRDMEVAIATNVDVESKIVKDFSDIISELLTNIDQMTKTLQSLSQNIEDQLSSGSQIRDQTAQKVESLNIDMSQLIDETLGTKVIDLSPTRAHQQLALYKIIDVRRDDEYYGTLGHIIKSELITISPSFSRDLSPFDRESAYLFVCRSGGRSARAARIAQISGFRKVYNLAGGMLAWNEARLPINQSRS